MFRTAAIAALTLNFWTSGPVVADTALLVGNASYGAAARIRGAHAITQAGPDLRAAGFAVLEATDLNADELREVFSRLLAEQEDTRLLIGLSGHFVSSEDGEVWFLGTQADAPNRANVGGDGIALSTVLALAAVAAGQSIVLLGTEERPMSLGAGLRAGIDLPEPPQGVTVISGPPRDIARLTRGSLTEPGVSLADALASVDTIEVAGFVSGAVPFMPRDTASDTVAAPNPIITSAERNLWNAVSELNTEGAYISYIRDYPQGAFLEEARAAISALRDDPVSRAEAAETALALSRNDRRNIQSDLNVLGFDTNGVDGIFGPGTRAAIRGWQAANDLQITGYLTAPAVNFLGDQGALRRAEIEAEELAARAERDRLDRAYWSATGAGQTEAGMRAYLTRYPEGIYASIAADRLAEIDDAAADRAARDDQLAWDFAREQDTVPAYRGYLAGFPEGAYLREARNRMAELQGEPLPFPTIDVAELAAQENALNLPGITRMLIERRLEGSGYVPGPADGQFDDQTRAAIAAFQEDEGLPPTGYLNQATLREFLADGIRVIVR
ncbi:MAG: peptidoglycan-binding protein [Pseudomonadota bacterium]